MGAKPIVLVYFIVSLLNQIESIPIKSSPPISTQNSEIIKVVDPTLDILHRNTGSGAQCSIFDINCGNAKNFVISSEEKWENFYVYIDPEYDETERIIIEVAAHRLSKILPCVKFRVWSKNSSPPLLHEGTYIHTQKTGSGCWSHIGKMSDGPQIMSLDTECIKIGTVMHEMIHALGLDHEQSRPDRDDYVDILWDNIDFGEEYNFQMVNKSKTFGVPYNTNSIMHYDSDAFSWNGKPTILTKDGDRIPFLRELQESDVIKLKRMYDC
ncbi:Meprin A subunit beta [Orchesella cincta]|uniref:Metalloendopeptidase n=1 Tax=Orchesella cincta TaxID=48709 RepID=A0A1D2N346_ORCCI|nr:Meprin A subunit beta [Orchesella cincta]